MAAAPAPATQAKLVRAAATAMHVAACARAVCKPLVHATCPLLRPRHTVLRAQPHPGRCAATDARLLLAARCAPRRGSRPRVGAGSAAASRAEAQCFFAQVLLGDMGAGKSSLVLRFVKGQFFDFQAGGTARCDARQAPRALTVLRLDATGVHHRRRFPDANGDRE